MIWQEPIWNKLYKGRLSWKKETRNLPNLLRGGAVLELGVGNGKTLQAIVKQNPKSITAIDFSEEAINKAKELFKEDKILFLKRGITSLKFKEEFDVVVCYYVLNNLLEKERKKAIKQMHKSLKPGGIIIFEDFAAGDFREKEQSRKIELHTIKRKDGLICHFFNKEEITDLFKGFSDIKVSTKIFSPLRADKTKERKLISAIIKK